MTLRCCSKPTRAGWTEHELQDADRLLDFATDALRSEIPNSGLRTPNFRPVARRFRRNDAAGTGFARRHFAALRARRPSRSASKTRRKPMQGIPGSPSGPPSARPISNAGNGSKICRIAKSASKCSNAMRKKTALPEIPDLQQLEAKLVATPVAANSALAQPALRNFRLTACANPEAEAAFAAREILKFRPRRTRVSATVPCWCGTSTIITNRWRARFPPL